MTLVKRNILIFIALIVLATILSGCVATKNDLLILDDKLNTIRKDQRAMAEQINYLDSLFRADAEEATHLRAEVRTSVNDLLEQFNQTQANLTDLQDKIAYLMKQGGQVQYLPPTTTTPTDTLANADSTLGAAEQPTEIMSAVNCQDLYDESFIFVTRGSYEDAIAGFTEFIKFCPTHDKADDARYWIGESYYSMEKYREAISEFDLLLRTYPDSEKRPTALFKMGFAYRELGQKKDAKDAFQKLIDDYPDTFPADQAKDIIKDL